MNPQTQVTATPQGGGAVPTKKNKVDVLKSILDNDGIKAQFRNALAKAAPKFLASILDLYVSDTTLAQCEPKQVVMEALKAAVLNLPINKALGYAYIVPYKNSKKVTDTQTGKTEWIKVMEPTFQLGYKGIIQLALRSGQFRTLNADVVYEGEVRKVNKLSGEIAFDGERISDKIVGYFCYFELLNGFSKTLYMTVEDMVAHAKRFSKTLNDVSVEQLANLANLPVSLDSKKVGWLGNFHAMAIKTCVRNLLSKWAPSSIDMQNAFSTDIESDEKQEGDTMQMGGGRSTMDLTNVEYEEIEAAPTDAMPPQQPAKPTPQASDDVPY